MVCYLAGSWSRRAEIAAVRDQLRAAGVVVQSRWLDEQHPPAQGREKFMRENAYVDLADVYACDILVRFSDDLTPATVPSHLATGSRMFEMGAAYAQGKTIIVVGGKQCLFDRLANIIHLRDTAELLRFLAPVEVN